jgi:hypothetical protein
LAAENTAHLVIMARSMGTPVVTLDEKIQTEMRASFLVNYHPVARSEQVN